MPRKALKIVLYLIVLLPWGAVAAAWACYRVVEWKTESFRFDNLEKLPENKVGLVLGTSRRVAGGRLNLYFQHRMEAAAELYRTGKVRCLVASGDNSLSYYNEPEDMAKALVKLGVPDSLIFRDYAGFRTLDSVVRCRAIFGQERFTVVSQSFHNARAIFIARQKGLEAVGWNARDVSLSVGFKTRLRECFARVKTMLDLFVLGVEPKFYGERVEIP